MASPISQVALDVSQLVNVINSLKRCYFRDARWRELGLQLGLLDTTLEAIEQDNPTMESRLRKCLSMWLSKADNVSKPTCDSLSAALRAIDEKAVADKLDTERAIAILSTHHPSLSQSLSDPISVARLLYGERLITEAILAEMESTDHPLSKKKEILLATVVESVQINYRSLQTVGIVLRKFTDNVQLGKGILNDYEKAFPGDKSVRWVKLTEEGQQMSNTSPSALASPQTPPVHVIEIPVLQSKSPEFTSIRTSFARMFLKFCRAMKETPPPLEELKHILKIVNRDLAPQLADADDLSSVLNLIEEECTLIDIEILETIVQEYEIKEAKKCIEEYKTTLEEFCESVSDQLCLKETFQTVVKTHPSLRCETATYVFDWEPGERKLKDITDILSKASGRLVKIKYINTGRSVIVTCTFPHSLIGFVIAKVMENLELLKENNLMELTIGYCVIWKRENKYSQTIEEQTDSVDNERGSLNETVRKKMSLEIEHLRKEQETLSIQNQQLQERLLVEKQQSTENTAVMRADSETTGKPPFAQLILPDTTQRKYSQTSEIELLKTETTIEEQTDSGDNKRGMKFFSKLSSKIKRFTKHLLKLSVQNKQPHIQIHDQATPQRDYTGIYCSKRYSQTWKTLKEKHRELLKQAEDDDEIYRMLLDDSCIDVHMYADPDDEVLVAVMSRGIPTDREKLKWWHFVSKDKTPVNKIGAEGFRILQVERVDDEMNIIQMGLLKAECPPLNTHRNEGVIHELNQTRGSTAAVATCTPPVASKGHDQIDSSDGTDISKLTKAEIQKLIETEIQTLTEALKENTAVHKRNIKLKEEGNQVQGKSLELQKKEVELQTTMLEELRKDYEVARDHLAVTEASLVHDQEQADSFV